MSKNETLLSNCPLKTAEPSRNYARVPGYKKKYKKNTRIRREKKRKMDGVEINTRVYVATRLLRRWDYLYAVTLKTKVFGDYNHARLEVSWITSTRDYFYAVTPAPRGKIESDIYNLLLFNRKDFPTELKRSDLGDLRVLLIIQNGRGISVVGLCLYLCQSCSSAILNCCGGLNGLR